METITFKGRVLPTIMHLNIEPESQAKWRLDDLGFDVTSRAKVKNSIVEVEFDTPSFDPKDISYYYTRAMDQARMMVDVCAFAMATSITVFFDRCERSDGFPYHLNIEDPSLRSLVTSYDMTNIIDALNVVQSDPGVFMAMNDLIQAITFPHHAPVNCARAVEGIRHLIAPGIETKKQWAEMKKVLNVDTAYLNLVTNTSTKPRHGDRTFISGPITTEVVRRSWILMDRFIHYRKGASKPLSDPPFPELKG